MSPELLLALVALAAVVLAVVALVAARSARSVASRLAGELDRLRRQSDERHERELARLDELENAHGPDGPRAGNAAAGRHGPVGQHGPDGPASQGGVPPSGGEEPPTDVNARLDSNSAAGREVDEHGRPVGAPRHGAIVVNPIRSDVEELRRLADRTTAMLGFPPVRMYETTIEDPGTGQARLAVEEGASVVIAAGGDGTVRAVSAGMAHTGVPMGVIPMGTGNLLATNLDLPSTSDRELLTIALTGRDRPMDMCVLTTEALTPREARSIGDSTRDDTAGIRATTDAVEAPFVVIGGLGFDAVMVGGVDERLKRRIGIFAYPVHALRHLFDHRIRGKLRMNAPRPVTGATAVEGATGTEAAAGADDVEVPTLDVTARSIMFANCGRLMSGVTLAPHAQIDDGWLDVVLLDTSGLKGWLDVTNKVLLQGQGRRSDLAILGDGRIDTHRARTVTVRTEDPHPVQVDGDIVAIATTVHARVEADALLVRTVR